MFFNFLKKHKVLQLLIFRSESIIHLILLVLSFISIIKCKIFGLKSCTYSISLPNSNGEIDFRGKYITDFINLKKNLNIVRSTNFINSIKFYFKNPNVIFFLSLKYFFSTHKYSKLKKKDDLFIKIDKKLKKIFEKIFLFLEIKKFMSIDDQRIMGLFLEICELNKIKSIGYMHYRFDESYKIMKIKSFDIFFVWSSFFKKKLIKINRNYKKKKIFITGIKRFKFKSKKKTIDLLIVLDLNTDYKFLFKLSKSLKKDGFQLAVKFKPSSIKDNKKWINFCQKNEFIFFKSDTFRQIRNQYTIKFFLAHSSTALYESCLYGAEPLIVKNKSKIASNILKENLIRSSKKNVVQISNIIKKKPSQKNINNQINKFWGKEIMNEKKIKVILNQ